MGVKKFLCRSVLTLQLLKVGSGLKMCDFLEIFTRDISEAREAWEKPFLAIFRIVLKNIQ